MVTTHRQRRTANRLHHRANRAPDIAPHRPSKLELDLREADKADEGCGQPYARIALLRTVKGAH